MTEPIEVRIEKLVYGGEGLARHEGQAVFAPFVLPGETVKVEPLERRKKFIRGRLASVTQPSSERIAAECPHFSVCGGCDYQHIPYEAQLRYKSEILRETLSRLGKVIWEGEITTHASPPYGYRNRAQWKIAPGRWRPARPRIFPGRNATTLRCAASARFFLRVCARPWAFSPG